MGWRDRVHPLLPSMEQGSQGWDQPVLENCALLWVQGRSDQGASCGSKSGSASARPSCSSDEVKHKIPKSEQLPRAGLAPAMASLQWGL